MSITGLSGTTPAHLVAQRVEVMALLWTALDGDAAYSANPRLQMITRLVPELAGLRATRLLGDMRRIISRDAIVKGLVRAGHGLAVAPGMTELVDALDAVSHDWEGLLDGLAAPLAAAYQEMRARADPLAFGLDPAADVAAVTGERDRFDLVVLPSLFLPPPQNGRHSALVDLGRDTGAIGYLHYGFPLDADPAQFGISRYWLLGGGWHYPVQRVLERHWPAISARLIAMPVLQAALSAALAEHRATVTWPTVLAEHVGIAIKCVLCARAGLPESVHRTFARTQGLALFDWFRAWADDVARDPATFVSRLHLLPEALAADRPALVALAAATHSGPSSINYALASREHRKVIVVPDIWQADLRGRIARRWSRITSELVGEGDWLAAVDRDASVIAFGQTGRSGIAATLLASRALMLDRSAAGGDLLIALFAAERALQPWRIAVTVHDPEVAGSFSAEHVMGLFHRTARFAGDRFVAGDDASG